MLLGKAIGTLSVFPFFLAGKLSTLITSCGFSDNQWRHLLLNDFVHCLMPVESWATLHVSPVDRTAPSNRALETFMPTQISPMFTSVWLRSVPLTPACRIWTPSAPAFLRVQRQRVSIQSSVRSLKPALTAICHTSLTYKRLRYSFQSGRKSQSD